MNKLTLDRRTQHQVDQLIESLNGLSETVAEASDSLQPDGTCEATVEMDTDGLTLALVRDGERVTEQTITWAELSPDHEIPPVDEDFQFSVSDEPE